MSGHFTLHLYHVCTSYLQLLQHPCSCHSHVLFKDWLLIIYCNFGYILPLKEPLYFVFCSKNSMSFHRHIQASRSDCFYYKKDLFGGPVLFRKRKIHSVNLSSGKFIFFQYFSFSSFSHQYI